MSVPIIGMRGSGSSTKRARFHGTALLVARLALENREYPDIEENPFYISIVKIMEDGPLVATEVIMFLCNIINEYATQSGRNQMGSVNLVNYLIAQLQQDGIRFDMEI